MQSRDGQVFVDPSGRRRRLARRTAVGVGTSFLCFLSVLAAGPMLGAQSLETDTNPLPGQVSQPDRADTTPSARPSEHGRASGRSPRPTTAAEHRR